jgi:hypothetical protein
MIKPLRLFLNIIRTPMTCIHWHTKSTWSGNNRSCSATRCPSYCEVKGTAS